MSRSYYKSTVSRNAMTHSRASEKKDKCRWHRKYRRLSNKICYNERNNADFAKYYLPKSREIANVYDFGKDGKYYLTKTDMIIHKEHLKVTKQLKFRK